MKSSTEQRKNIRTHTAASRDHHHHPTSSTTCLCGVPKVMRCVSYYFFARGLTRYALLRFARCVKGRLWRNRAREYPREEEPNDDLTNDKQKKTSLIERIVPDRQNQMIAHGSVCEVKFNSWALTLLCDCDPR